MAHKMARMLHLEFAGLGWSDSTRAPGLLATKLDVLKGYVAGTSSRLFLLSLPRLSIIAAHSIRKVIRACDPF